MRKILSAHCVGCLLLLFTLSRAEADPNSDCLLDELLAATGDTTASEIKAKCAPLATGTGSNGSYGSGAIDERLALEKDVENGPWAITPHRPNYFLGLTKNSRFNDQPFADDADLEGLKEEEMKFQLSFKFPLWYGVLGSQGDLYAAYTNQSWWQAFGSDISQPFREVNHEPEVFLRLPSNTSLFGLDMPVFDIGLSHQSNGRSEPLSRSWNRLYANFLFERGDFAMSIRPWIVLGDPKDNPNIEDFMGHGEMRFAYRWNKNVFAGLLRNNLQADENRSGIELSWSYPVTDHMRIYTQYYYGYGESLLDYNARTNRIGIGVALNDYLR